MDQEDLLDTPFANQRTMLKSPKRMSRSTITVLIAIGALFVVIGLFLASGKGSNDRYRTLQAFPTSDFFENHESLIGGVFKLSATLDAELGTETGRGKLVTFKDSQSKMILPVIIPPEVMPSHTLSKSQRYRMIVEVSRKGVLSATNLEKE